MFPAPVVLALLAPRERRIRRRKEEVLGAKLRRAIDDAFVFRAPLSERHVDLVVVHAPSDHELHGLLWLVHEERPNEVRKRLNLVLVHPRPDRLRRFQAPFRNQAIGLRTAGHRVGSEQSAIGEKRSVGGTPLQRRFVSNRKRVRRPRNLQKRVLDHGEQPP